jgi:hypothetical protein
MRPDYEHAKAGSHFDALGEIVRISSRTLVIYGAENR